MIQVRVLAFGVLRDSLGSEAVSVDLTEDATVAELLAQLGRSHPAVALRGIAVSVNAEYATAGTVLRAGDEVGLLPPVSGGVDGPGTARPGAARTASDLDEGIGQATVIALTRERIDAELLVAAAKHSEDGAVVVFDGIVRNHSRGRATLHLDYEAYEDMAEKQMRALAAEARAKFEVRHVTIVHRLGRLEIGETSVLIVVASAHRAQAFEANRWLIDTLKKTVPIWKKETFADGAVWANGEPFPADICLEAGDGL